MLPYFRNKLNNISGKTGGWNTFYSQVQGASKLKLKKVFICFGIHTQATIREAPTIYIQFDRQVQGSFRQTWWLWNFFCYTSSKSYPDGIG